MISEQHVCYADNFGKNLEKLIEQVNKSKMLFLPKEVEEKKTKIPELGETTLIISVCGLTKKHDGGCVQKTKSPIISQMNTMQVLVLLSIRR